MLVKFMAYAQNLPTGPENSFIFPIGSKFTIRLFPKDSTHFDYAVIRFEPYRQIVDTWENDTLFEEEGEDGTIDFYFCLATSGKTEEERKEKMQIVLLMKNRTEYALSYDSDIQIKKDGEFETTSNVGVFPKAKGMEMWPYMIYQIKLSNIRKMRF